MTKNPYRAYQNTQVTTASPQQILLMLYEGAIRFVKIARLKMEEKKIAEKGKYISKTMDIICELINTLDHRVGGQLSQDLEGLYVFMQDKLISANTQNNPEDLEVVEKLLTTLYTSWEDVITNPRPDGVPSPKLQPDLYSQYIKANSAG